MKTTEQRIRERHAKQRPMNPPTFSMNEQHLMAELDTLRAENAKLASRIHKLENPGNRGG